MLVRQSTTVPKTSKVMARTSRTRSLNSCPAKLPLGAQAAVRVNAAASMAADPPVRNARRLLLFDIVASSSSGRAPSVDVRRLTAPSVSLRARPVHPATVKPENGSASTISTVTPARPEPDSNPRQPPASPTEAVGAITKDDRTLISRIARQDTAALAALYDRHADAVYSLAVRITNEPSEAEGVVQEVFSQIWFEAARYLDDDVAVSRLLLERTRELAIAQARAGGRNPATDRGSPGDAATVRLPQPALGLNDDLADPASAARLRDALARLPLLTRLSIELAYFDGLTLEQIARQLDQPEKAVHKRIRSGLSELLATIGENDR
ncbi:MAG: sigma-70 family RNA polymerase sigma factor [Acidobacteria bacterium]|nr:sigma-70 family RNA polymerase sigma factor [Acidobacteriota bacterium]MYJ03108.1 sigma-70 family RNA polymerase sigma factor [Acidobacteriota bacterium]